MLRTKGYLPDRPGEVYKPASELLAGLSPGELPERVSRRDLFRPMLQYQASACVAHAVIEATEMRWRALQPGVEVPRLSRQALYWGLRAFGGLLDRDVGGYPADAIRAFNEGYCLEEDCPYNPSDVYTPPGPAIYRLAWDQRAGISAHRLSDQREARVLELKQALASDVFPVIGMRVDKPFEQNAGGTWTYKGPATGGHCVTAVGYGPQGVEIGNWWQNWGDGDGTGNGFGFVSWETFGDTAVVDSVYAITFARWPVREP